MLLFEIFFLMSQPERPGIDKSQMTAIFIFKGFVLFCDNCVLRLNRKGGRQWDLGIGSEDTRRELSSLSREQASGFGGCLGLLLRKQPLGF